MENDFTLSISEAAAMLKTGIATVSEQVERGTIPAYREGRNWKIPRPALVEYAIDRAKKEAAERRKLVEERMREER